MNLLLRQQLQLLSHSRFFVGNCENYKIFQVKFGLSKVLYLTAFSFMKITQQQDQFSWKQRSYRANTYKIAWSKILIITKFENSMGESHFLVDGIPTQLIILLVSFYHQLSCSLNEMFQSSCFFQILSSAVWLGGFSYILT